MAGRESNRIKDSEKKRVLDEVARGHRARKALEALEQDNFHEDPHADLVMSKKIPKFEDNLKMTKEKKAKRKGADYFRNKYRKNLSQLLEEGAQNYFKALAPVPDYPARTFCAVCGDYAKYSCTACGTSHCSIQCLGVHQDTRCLKWTS